MAPPSQSCHQHKPSRTSVTKIDFADLNNGFFLNTIKSVSKPSRIKLIHNSKRKIMVLLKRFSLINIIKIGNILKK